MSLVKSISYGGNAAAGKAAALKWGCDHEEDAKEYYIREVTRKHFDLCVLTAGLFINKDYPEIGASSDGIIR